MDKKDSLFSLSRKSKVLAITGLSLGVMTYQYKCLRESNN